MVEALGESVDVVDHRPEQIEVRLVATVPNLAHEIEHAVQHCCQCAVLMVNDANCLHACYAFCQTARPSSGLTLHITRGTLERVDLGQALGRPRLSLLSEL